MNCIYDDGKCFCWLDSISQTRKNATAYSFFRQKNGSSMQTNRQLSFLICKANELSPIAQFTLIDVGCFYRYSFFTIDIYIWLFVVVVVLSNPLEARDIVVVLTSFWLLLWIRFLISCVSSYTHTFLLLLFGLLNRWRHKMVSSYLYSQQETSREQHFGLLYVCWTNFFNFLFLFWSLHRDSIAVQGFLLQ